MFKKLELISLELQDIQTSLLNPDIVKNQTEYQRLTKRLAEISPIVDLYNDYLTVQKAIEEAREMIKVEKDKDLIDLAKEELEISQNKDEEIKNQLKTALIPKDPNDHKNIYIEIRAGTGGEEASLFASELVRMYMKFSENKHFKHEIMVKKDSDSGGIKEMIIKVIGNGAYSQFKYESGVHRVQRVPATESKGRLHTSAATVAVLPEADEIDVQINEEDLEITTCRASGAGGQHVNVTDSAVRVFHKPSGLAVECQDERSQGRNKSKAISILRTRLFTLQIEKQAQERGEERLAQVGTGDRSEKIRTYNYPQDRVTDHRINVSWSNLPSILQGNIEDIVERLTLEDQSRKLAESGI